MHYRTKSGKTLRTTAIHAVRLIEGGIIRKGWLRCKADIKLLYGAESQTGIAHLVITAALLVGASGLACNPPPQPQVCVEFFRKNSTPRLAEFREYDLEKQLLIHRCGLDWHPRYDHSYEIAERGREIIPRLLEELRRTEYRSRYDSDLTKYGIILIFQRLADEGDLINDKAILEALDQALSGMTTNWIREEAALSVADIKRTTGEERTTTR